MIIIDYYFKLNIYNVFSSLFLMIWTCFIYEARKFLFTKEKNL